MELRDLLGYLRMYHLTAIVILIIALGQCFGGEETTGESS